MLFSSSPSVRGQEMPHNSDCFLSLVCRLKRQQDTGLYSEDVNNRIKCVWSNCMFNLLVSFLENIDFLPCAAQMFFLWKQFLEQKFWKCFLSSCLYQETYPKGIVSRWTICLLLLSLDMLIFCVVWGVIYHALKFFSRFYLVTFFLRPHQQDNFVHFHVDITTLTEAFSLRDGSGPCSKCNTSTNKTLETFYSSHFHINLQP